MPRIARLLRAFTVVAAVFALALVAAAAYLVMRDRAETVRAEPRFDPPVWAGQNVPGCGTGGFYARDQQEVVLTVAPHCFHSKPGTSMFDPDGRLVGIFGPLAELPECPAGRFCAPADIVPLILPPDRIPWGHLNMVDMGAGGYTTISAGTRPLTCSDIHMGDPVELNGRERYRTGTVIEVGRYEHATDTIFPCMVVTDIEGGPGDSGSAVLVDGLPAGTVSRLIGRYLAFTPLAEGLVNLGLVLCTTPDCGVSPNPAE